MESQLIKEFKKDLRDQEENAIILIQDYFAEKAWWPSNHGNILVQDIEDEHLVSTIKLLKRWLHGGGMSPMHLAWLYIFEYEQGARKDPNKRYHIKEEREKSFSRPDWKNWETDMIEEEMIW